jgi:uncharacterized repeat protein (TIGR01451 family)
MKSKTKRLLAILMTFVMTLGVLPLSAFAVEQTVQGSPVSVTDRYLNEADAREIAPPQTVTSPIVKNPQNIIGYEYVSYSEVTEHIYAKEDLTYTIGYPDKTVRGERYLSRAEAATIFYRLYDGFYPQVQRQMTSSTFNDVPKDAWYYTELELCYNVGLVNGYYDGNFRPNNPVTRAEFAVLAARYAELTNSNKVMFRDVTADHWAYLLINAAAEAKWIQGYGDGNYRPERIINRSEAVTLINHMRNRSITVEKLKELGVTNPYIDLVETYWAYTDLMEATVKHSVTDWHHLTYNDGNMNIIIERYLDLKGNEIAEPTVTQGKANYAARQFDRHYYLGYITIIDYEYNDGSAHMIATKSVDKSTAKVGDTLAYTITAGNVESATANLENVVITDSIPEYLSFVYGSVQVDGKTTQYSYDNLTKKLSINLGDIAPGQTKTITFTAVISDNAYGKAFANVAVLSADNDEDKLVTDTGVTVDDGTAFMSITKSVNKPTAKVGDSLTYTITAGNAENATADLKNVVMRDAISEYLTFSYGSVQVDSATANYSYDSETGLLSVELGDIAPGQLKTITFAAVVNASAYGKSFYNVAALSADNADDKTAKDDGVIVEDGTANMSATKSVNKSTAKVGDTLTYTITATNAATSTVNLRDVVMNDSISEYLSFSYGSVQVDGYNAKYSYNNDSRQLSVELGDIAPGQTKKITFAAVINSTAYGKSFINTVILSANNDDDKIVSDGGVTVDDGTAEGSVGAKTVSASTAKVGDTLTYTITLRNASTATAAWDNVKVSDVIPEYLSFISGSVEEDGRISSNASYNAGTKTLTLFADSIGPGESKTFTFKVTVQDGAQGKYIVNTAVVSSDGREDIQLPDTGVQIDAGNTDPLMSKTASVTEAHAGDIFTYYITLKNGMDATVAWKNVVLSDVLPTGVKLVSGSVALNGQTVLYGIAGQAIEVTVGDLKPGAEAVVSFDVRVLDSAEGTTIENVAVAKGDNGNKTATDNGVTVPKPKEDENQDNIKDTVAGTKTVDKTIVNTGDKVTFTITAINNTKEAWTNVQVYDVLDTSVLTLIDDSIYIDGIRYLSGSGKWSFIDRQLVVNLGDIAAGQSVKSDFAVQFKNDAANSTYVNQATIKSTNKTNVYVKAPEIVIMSGGIGTHSYTDIHYRLFNGYADPENNNPLYLWKPEDSLLMKEICYIGYRLMTDYYRSSIGNGIFTVPDDVSIREAQYFISHGIISAAEFTPGEKATQAQIYRVLNFAIGANLSSGSAANMSRVSVASLICDLTNRDKKPNTNGLPLAYFSDKGPYAALIDEVSNSHDFTVDSIGKENWISILND